MGEALTTIEISILLFLSLKPREQLSVIGLLPTLVKLQSLDLATVTELYPGMPEENVWTVTWKGIQLIKEYQQDDHHRYLQVGPSPLHS